MKLIVVVFILNFSLFFSRVIVDAGNLTARVFYNSVSMTITDSAERNSWFNIANGLLLGKADPESFRSISGAFMLSLNGDQLVGDEDAQKEFKGESPLIVFIFVMVIFSAINFFVAKNFFKASFMFIGRLVHITFYMIASPFYFLFLFLPIEALSEGDSTSRSFESGWLIPLFQRSFCIVAYLFFI